MPAAYQPTLDDVGVPLWAETFVVVDLETTGTSSASSSITEIGAVKVRGGEVLGEFQTLVNPGQPISPFVSALTGITNGMVAQAPQLSAVLPQFLEFARGATLVAHNAPFDIGFLRAACAALDYPWPRPRVVDTVVLARRAVPRSETPNYKLSTLAQFFHARVDPEHRALADARATVDVLHGVFERLAALGVTHTSDLDSLSRSVPDAVRRKHTLADGLTEGPGLYRFHAPDGEVLYIGTSRHVRRRVRSYFTESEKRGRIAEMLRIATRVSDIPCATVLEAQVREVRAIAAVRPRYNRRSTHPEHAWWLVVEATGVARLRATRERLVDRPGLGPFSSRTAAFAIRDAIERAIRPVDAVPGEDPAARGRNDPAHLDERRAALLQAVTDGAHVTAAMCERMATLATQERFEEAAHLRDVLTSYLTAGDRHARAIALSNCGTVTAAAPSASGRGWDVHIIAAGRLVAAGHAADAAGVATAAEALAATAEQPAEWTDARAAAEECRLIDTWLHEPRVRLAPEVSPAAVADSPFAATAAAAHITI